MHWKHATVSLLNMSNPSLVVLLVLYNADVKSGKKTKQIKNDKFINKNK